MCVPPQEPQPQGFSEQCVVTHFHLQTPHSTTRPQPPAPGPRGDRSAFVASGGGGGGRSRAARARSLARSFPAARSYAPEPARCRSRSLSIVLPSWPRIILKCKVAETGPEPRILNTSLI
ncbi:high mobility group protein HMG-I/HMG-Y isoform X3 [Notamacropus eugenii]|uniref:high mobility group protein HMG-I/HMG-Y isoform X3 n=1 Tax=Notamacropus eugenii TaxID=9315 RepID=UPI003B6775CF